jgi:hypothetical protein
VTFSQVHDTYRRHGLEISQGHVYGTLTPEVLDTLVKTLLDIRNLILTAEVLDEPVPSFTMDLSRGIWQEAVLDALSNIPP